MSCILLARFAAITLLASLAAADTGPVQQEVAWTGLDGNTWSAEGAWSCPLQPKGCIPDNKAAFTYSVLIDASAVDLDISVTIDRLRMLDDATLTWNPVRLLSIVADTAGTGDTGTVRLRNASLVLDHGDLIASGPAASTLTIGGEGGGTAFVEMIEGTIRGQPGGEAVLFESDTVVRGSGFVGSDTVGIVNKGMILAGLPGQVLIVDPGADNMVSDGGLLGAENGGTLRLMPAVYDRANSEPITAFDASFVELHNATIMGGAFDTSGTGEVRVADHLTYAVDTTNLGHLVVNPNAQGLHLQGSLVNMGTLELRSEGLIARLLVDTPDALLSGGGTIWLNGSNALVNATTTGNTLTNIDNTIRGEGGFGLSITRVVNHGTIVADGATPLVLFPVAGADAVINFGELRAENGSRLRLSGETGGSDFENGDGVIKALDGSIVELDNATIIGGLLLTEGTGEIEVADNLTFLRDIANGGRIALTSGVQGLHLEGVLINTGTVAFRDTGRVIVEGSDVVLKGAGTFEMANANAIISPAASGDTLTNVDNTIRGGGRIGESIMYIVNHGTIVADDAVPMVVFPIAGPSALVNTGRLWAESGGRLVLRSDVGGSEYLNAGGEIRAFDGSIVELESPMIVGGALITDGTGEIVVTGPGTKLIDVLNVGRIAVPNGISGLHLEGTIVNGGTIELLGAAGQNTTLLVDEDVHLEGGGGVLMGGARATITDSSSSNTLTNVDNTIHGAGILGQNLLDIINEPDGTILADGAMPLIVEGRAGAGFENRGALTAGGTGGVDLAAAPFVTSGEVVVMITSTMTRSGNYTQTGGSTTVDGTLTVTGSVELQGGVLAGSGAVNGRVDNVAGRVAPGSSTGALAVSGDYIQGVDGAFEAEIAGLVPDDDHDQLQVGGGVTLAGELVLAVVDAFSPQPGDEFTIITSGGDITGTFDVVDCTIGFEVVYEQHAVVAVYEGNPCSADADCSGDVAFGDLLAILGAWGPYDPCPPYRPEDIDGDCAVTFTDLLAVLSAWGPCPESSG